MGSTEEVYIPISKPYLIGNYRKYVNDCMDTNWLSSKGEYIQKFEEAFADFVNVKHAIATSSGTTALHTALMAMGIQKEDEVIIPSLTYIATANAVKYIGARPIITDCHPTKHTIDTKDIENKITEKTKAIIPVHLGGNPCNMKTINKISRKYNLKVLEDCAQSFGSTYMGKHTGTYGNAGIFSFFGNKTITTGEGGMIITNDNNINKLARSLINQGQANSIYYEHDRMGYNYRMTNIQAAIGLSQIEYASMIINMKRRITQWYHEELNNLINNWNIIMQETEKESKPCKWMNFITINKHNPDIESLMNHMRRDKVETRPMFKPLEQMSFIDGEDCINAQNTSATTIMLPSATDIKKGDIIRISNTIRKWMKRR